MARVKTLAGYPVKQYDSPNGGGQMDDHRGLVLHIAQGTYQGTISWQMNPDQRYADGTQVTTCSTWIVGRNPGEIAQMKDSDLIAWCQRSGSRTWHSVELAGYAPNPPTAWQIEASAHLLVWEHHTYGVPLQATSNTSGQGLGHHSMDNDTTVEWGHDSCPGSGVIAAKDDIVKRAQAILTGGDDDMDAGQFLALLKDPNVSAYLRALPWTYPVRTDASALAVFGEIRALVGGDDTDEAAIVAGVLAGLTPEAIAAAIPAELAKQVADELAARLQA